MKMVFVRAVLCVVIIVGLAEGAPVRRSVESGN